MVATTEEIQGNSKNFDSFFNLSETQGSFNFISKFQENFFVDLE